MGRSCAIVITHKANSIIRYIKSVIMNSQTYTGYLPVATPDFTANAPSILRKVNADNPVFDVYSPDITCHTSAVPISDNGVSRVGTVKAGGIITYQWNEWSHLSPMLTYMARCASDNCGTFTGREGPVVSGANTFVLA